MRDLRKHSWFRQETQLLMGNGMHWDGAERGLSSSVAGKGEDLVGGRELVL